MVLGLRTAIYHVPNLAEAKAWYSSAFEVQPYFDEPFYVGFNIGGYELGLGIGIAAGFATLGRIGFEGRFDYGLTHSCYDPAPEGRPCGRCDSCVLRAKGFLEAGVADPLLRR